MFVVCSLCTLVACFALTSMNVFGTCHKGGIRYGKITSCLSVEKLFLWYNRPLVCTSGQRYGLIRLFFLFFFRNDGTPRVLVCCASIRVCSPILSCVSSFAVARRPKGTVNRIVLFYVELFAI